VFVVRVFVLNWDHFGEGLSKVGGGDGRALVCNCKALRRTPLGTGFFVDAAVTTRMVKADNVHKDVTEDNLEDEDTIEATDDLIQDSSEITYD